MKSKTVWKLFKNPIGRKYLIFISWLKRIGSPKIHKGDLVKCLGYGYPHWGGNTFIVTAVFPNGDLGIKNSIRVSSTDFIKIKKLINEI